MDKNWIKLTLTNLIGNKNLLKSILYKYNTIGLQETGKKIEAYFPGDIEMENLKKKIYAEVQNINCNLDILAETITPQDWESDWRKEFSSIKISEKLKLVPEWQNNCEEEITIKINPGMAFGTGDHPTTKMCLKLLEKYITKGIKVLDAGCGSGILTIAASKLGASFIEAWDISKDVKENFNYHTKINNISNYELVIKDIDKIERFNYDLIVSNIQKNPNINLLNKLSQDNFLGTIIFSGILEEDINSFKKEIDKTDKKIFEMVIKDGWASFVLNN